MRAKPVHTKALEWGPLVYRTLDNIIFYYQHYSAMPDMGDERHHLHFVTKDHLKEEEYGIDKRNMEVIKTTKGWPNHHPENYYKIVATSDRAIHKDSGIPMIPERYIQKFAYHDGILEYVELEEEKVYIEPEGIHPNRGHFETKLKMDDTVVDEVVIIGGDHIKETEDIDLGNFTIDQIIEHLLEKFEPANSTTSMAIFKLITKFKNTQKGIEWVLKEYTDHVNDQDAITDKLNELLDNK